MSKLITRRNTLLGSTAAAAASTLTSPAIAQAFPAKPVTLIVPWPPGGSTDISMRKMAEVASKHLGQPITIDNKAGASGTAGPATMAATARPDGYTIAQLPISVFRLPYMMKTAFDPMKDFTYIVHVTGYTFGVVVKKDSPYRTFKDLVEAAKKEPGKIKYATPGAGTSLHITMEQIALKAGIKWTQVPFKGGAETNAAVLGGHVDATADSTGWGSLVNAGELRLLCTWGAQRTKRWPEVPTLMELGYDIIADSPFGIGGPKGMQPDVVKKLHDAFKIAVEDKDVIETLNKLDMAPRYMDTASYHKFAMDTIKEQRELIEKLGLKS